MTVPQLPTPEGPQIRIGVISGAFVSSSFDVMAQIPKTPNTNKGSFISRRREEEDHDWGLYSLSPRAITTEKEGPSSTPFSISWPEV